MKHPCDSQSIRFPYLEASILLISTAMLMFEILQTITLSLQTIERNAFLVISLCLLGLGGGGSLATWFGKGETLSPVRVLWWSSLAFGISLVLSAIWSSWSFNLAGLIVLGLIPYVFVGIYLASLFKSWPRRVHRSYFMNLVGSGMGCMGLVWILNGTGDAALTVIIIAGIALFSTVLIGASLSPGRWVVPLVVMVLLIGLTPFRNSLFGFLPAPDKGLGLIVDNPEIESHIEWSRWGYLGRLDVLRPGKGIENFPLGGEYIRKILGRGCEVRYLFANGGNWTKAIDFRNNSAYRETFVKNSLHAAPYIVTDRPDVLNIGIGGGVDVFLALQCDARSVVGVEINPLMIEAGLTQLSGYFGGFYNDPRFTVKEMDGRTYVQNTSQKFGVITLTAVDTGALLHANAQVLSENYLYTQEAFDEYFRILDENGFIYISRPYRQMMRILATGVSALRRAGMENPEEHIAVMGRGKARRGGWRSVLLGKSPLSGEHGQALLERYGRRICYLPGYSNNQKFYERFFDAVKKGKESGFIARSRFNFSPVWDDRPFFYQFGRNVLGSVAGGLLLKILLWVTVAAAVLILLPLYRFPLAGEGFGRRLFGVVGYFGAIGAGFMFIEICLIQKLVLFLGHPSYSVSVTLFSILVFSGLGSMFSRRLSARKTLTAVLIWGPILAAAVFYGAGLGFALPHIHSESLWLRVLVVAALLAPGSFFMGMPFPTMISLLIGRDQILIPWAWAVNAFTSVAASILTVLFAMELGFTTVMYFGAVCYIVALLFYLQRIKYRNTDISRFPGTMPGNKPLSKKDASC